MNHTTFGFTKKHYFKSVYDVELIPVFSRKDYLQCVGGWFHDTKTLPIAPLVAQNLQLPLDPSPKLKSPDTEKVF